MKKTKQENRGSAGEQVGSATGKPTLLSKATITKIEAEVKRLQDTGRGGAPGILYAVHMKVTDESCPGNLCEWFEFVTFDNLEQLESWIWRAHRGALLQGFAEIYTTKQYFSVQYGELMSEAMTFVKRIG